MAETPFEEEPDDGKSPDAPRRALRRTPARQTRDNSVGGGRMNGDGGAGGAVASTTSTRSPVDAEHPDHPDRKPSPAYKRP
jgi:hypothetical protein